MSTMKDLDNAPSFVVHSLTTLKVPKCKRLVAASFDGEAIPSLIANTVVLRRIEERIHSTGETRFQWHKHFLIFGSSGIGGLLVLLLGRLHVPLCDILKLYEDLSLSRESDTPSELKTLGGWFRNIFGNKSITRDIPDEMVKLIQQRTKQDQADDSNSRMFNQGPDSLPVFVVVPSRTRQVCFERHRDARIFRSYELADKTTTVANVAHSAYVSRPLRDPSAFRRLDEDGLLDLCNPAELLFHEAEGLYGYGLRFRLLLSIGSSIDKTGTSQPVSRRETERRTRLHDKALETHERVTKEFRKEGRGTYVRMYIPGLCHFAQDDFSDAPKVIAKTNEFLDSEVGERAMDVVVKQLLSAVATFDDESTIRTVDFETMAAESAKVRSRRV